MNQAQAKAILDWPEFFGDFKAVYKALDTPPGSDATMRAWAMDRIRWIANGGTLESYPKSPQDAPGANPAPEAAQPAESATAGNAEAGKGIQAEIAAAVLPLVDALESLLDYSDYKNRETARKLCREAREKWGTK